MLEGVLACVAALILGRGVGRGLADFSPSPRDSAVAHCCIVTFVDFPLSFEQMSVFGVEVLNLPLLLGCGETDEFK